jgi:hypothetical protein
MNLYRGKDNIDLKLGEIKCEVVTNLSGLLNLTTLALGLLADCFEHEAES